MTEKIKWRVNTLPIATLNRISNRVLCRSSKGLIVLQYDYVFKIWYDPQDPVKSFDGEVFKWSEISE